MIKIKKCIMIASRFYILLKHNLKNSILSINKTYNYNLAGLHNHYKGAPVESAFIMTNMLIGLSKPSLA